MKIFDHLINLHNMILNQHQHIIIIKTTIRTIIRIKATKIDNLFNKIKINLTYNFSIKYLMSYQL